MRHPHCKLRRDPTIQDAMRFLTGYASARWLTRKYDPSKVNHLRNWLVPIFLDLQNAHDRLVSIEATRQMMALLQGLRSGLITTKAAKDLLKIEVPALDELVKYLAKEPLAKSPKIKRPRSRRKN